MHGRAEWIAGMSLSVQELKEAEAQYRFTCPPEFKARVEAAFEGQGANLKTGTMRVLEFFAAQPKDFRALMLRQVSDEAVILLAEHLLRDTGGWKIGTTAKKRKKKAAPATPAKPREQ